MKSSVKFREEKSPLLRAKMPFKLGCIPFSSGVTAGTKEDLAFHFATGFSCGPIIKLAFKPHHPNPLSLVVKGGLGLWGAPHDAPFMLTAEICLAPKVHDRLLSVCIKPRFGDFSIRKDVKNLSLLPQQKELARTSVCLRLNENGEENHARTALKGENGSLSRSLSNGDAKAVPPQMNGNSANIEQLHSSSIDSGNAVVGSNFSLRVEGLDNGLPTFRKSRLEGVGEVDEEADMSTLDNSMIFHVPHDRLHEHMKKSSHKSSASFSLAGARDAFQGCRIVTHSSLPLGSHSRLNIRWGLNAASDFLQGWDGSLPNLSFGKLPSLLLEKISFEQVLSSSVKIAEHGSRGSSEQSPFPATFVEENRELAQVAALCYTMKRQLLLMHVENQVLRRAMEDMKSHVENSSWITNGAADSMLKDGGHSMPRLPRKSPTLDAESPSWLGGEGSNRDVQVQKGKRVVPKREDLQPKSIPVASNSDDVSKELEKAILSARTGSNVGKKE